MKNKLSELADAEGGIRWRLCSKGVTNVRKWLREIGFVAKT